ncbi:Ubiquitin carboxyl-terminal hydrolase 34 [Tritrichomonas musculus]|uniref:Ubiquitin carboxyl-terminal hydrolase 34 n=1 Tax=Tritrichomonas musculus TaxID=1915356 RepID=A0ABR2HAA7_9EUKA
MLDTGNFEEWEPSFLENIEANRENIEFIPTVNQLLKSIRKKKPISPFLNDETNLSHFISSKLPKIIDNLLNSRQIFREEEAYQIYKFFKRVIYLLPNIEKYTNPYLTQSVSRIFNINSLVYQKNKSFISFQKICKAFTDQKDILNDSLKKMIYENHHLFIDYFNLLLTIYTSIMQNDYIQNEIDDNTNNLINFFKEFINQNSHILSISVYGNQYEKAVDSFKRLLKLMNNSKFVNDETIYDFFIFFEELLSSENIEINKFLAFCLSAIIQNPKFERIIFTNAKKQKGSFSIINSLTSMHFTNDVFKELTPFLKFQINYQLISYKDLAKLWIFCSKSPFLKTSPTFIDIFTYALKFLDLNESKDFITLIEKDFSPFYYDLLTKSIIELQNSNETIKISIFCTQKLLNLALNDDKARKSMINLLLNQKLNNTIYHSILSQIPKLLKQEKYTSFCCSLMEKIFNASSNPYLLLKEEELNISQILNEIDGERGNPIIQILFQLYIKTKLKPSTQLIKHITENAPKDEFWLSIKKLLENNVYQNRNEIQQFLEIAEKQNPQVAPRSFLKFLKILIFKFSNNSFIAKNGYYPANNLKSDFKINTSEIPGLDIVLKIYQYNDDQKTVSSSKKFLLKILKNWKNNCSVDFLNENIQKIICILQSKSIVSIENLKPLFLSLQLVLDYIKESEVNSDPEDFSSPRHSYLENYIQLTINVKTSFSSSKQYKIHFDPKKTLNNLKERIANREETSIKNVSYPDFSCIHFSSTLIDCGLTNNSKINVKCYSSNSQLNSDHQPPPSFFFNEVLFPDILLNLLEVNTYPQMNSLCFQILQLLPTSKSIIDTFSDENDRLSSIYQQIQSTKSSYKKLYLIQSLSEKANVFGDQKIVSILLILFNDNSFTKDILNFIREKYNGEKFVFAQEFARRLIHLLNESDNEEFLSSVFSILNLLSENNEIPLDNESLTVFEGLNESLWEYISVFIGNAIKKSNSNDNISKYFISRITDNFENSQFHLFMLKRILTSSDLQRIHLFYRRLLQNLEKYSEMILEEEQEFTQFQSFSKKSNYAILSNIIECLSLIISKFASLVSNIQIPVSNLLNIAFGKNSALIQTTIFNFLSKIITNEQYNEIIISKMKEMINYAVDEWYYNPSTFTRNEPYSGLRNLGDTCYLNSVFQQLYHLDQIRHLITTHEFKKEDELKTLQDIFLSMRYTSRPFADTTSFVETWHDCANELINPREQQDAVEFFLSLANSFPENIKKMFEGEMKHYIKGIRSDFERTNKEVFYNICVSIKNHRDISSSFKEFIQDKYLHDHEKPNNSQMIHTKILKLPEILVIQLNRFEYDQQTMSRKKINNKFEFSKNLNVEKIIDRESNESDYLYELSGIIIHRGVATGGHYYSYILKNDGWWCFNDSSVSKANENEVFQEAYGGFDQHTSAYVLFYKRKSFKPFEKAASHKKEIENNSFVSIIENNNSFEKAQSLFRVEVIDFVQKINDPIINMQFFIRVLCHSRNHKKSNEFISNLKEIINSNEKSVLFKLADFLNENVVEIVKNYLNSHLDAFVNDMNDIILYCFNSLDQETSRNKSNSIVAHDKSFEFFGKLVDEVKKHASSYKKLPAIFKLIKKYISDHSYEAFTHLWLERLTSFLDEIYDSRKNKNMREIKELKLNDLTETIDIIQSKVKGRVNDIFKKFYSY